MRRALALWLVLLGAYAATSGLDAGPGAHLSARETHVLLAAESIVSDRDVDLGDEYAQAAWRRWDAPPVAPTAALTEGRLLEPTGLGFPLLVAPAYALGGVTLVELWLAALCALGFVLAAALGRRLVPEPWPTAAALVVGLSPPVLTGATAVSPEVAGGTVLAAAALAALALRPRPRLGLAVVAAVGVALAPWLTLALVAPTAVVAVALARWLRRRGRGFAALVALEVVFLSAVVYVTLVDRLYGGLTPYAPSPAPGGGTGLEEPADVLARLPRLAGVWLDRDAGLLRWAPFAALALFAVWLLWRSVRDRLATVVPERIDVEVTAGFLAAACAAQLAAAALLAPALDGAWTPARLVLPVAPLGAALAAWGLRVAPRAGAALAAVTLAGSAWLVVGADGVAPVRGAVPWGGAEELLPEFGGAAGPAEIAVAAGAALALALLALREWRARRRLAAGRLRRLPV